MKQKKIINEKSVSVTELLEIVGDSVIKDLVRRFDADKWVIKLETQTVFKLILYSLLDSERISLRTMAENYNSVPFSILEQSTIGKKTAHSSIRDRLVNINVSFFKHLYEHSQTKLLEQYSGKQLIAGYNIKRYDSTMIAVFSHLLEGMKVGNTSKKKNQVKMTTELVNDFEIRMRFFKDQDHLGEEVALKEMILSQTHDPSSLIVFDRGLKSRETFCEFNDLKTQFLTRLNDRNRYKFIRKQADVPSETLDGLRFVQDSIVYLYGDGSKLVKEEFRLIEAECLKNGKKLFFLTNILFLDAQTIAQIYRQRWDIEVFFRFIKQEMNATHFVCNDVNAIQVMIYCTLIVAMLILIYMRQNNIKSYKIAKIRFFNELQAAITLELIETPKGLENFKWSLKDYIKKSP
jgi:Transposase DDE domain